MYFICVFLGGGRGEDIPECCHSLTVGRGNLENVARGGRNSEHAHSTRALNLLTAFSPFMSWLASVLRVAASRFNSLEK